MIRRLLLLSAGCMAALALSLPAPAPAAPGWLTYKGAWFDIKHPQGFVVRESLPSATSTRGYDSVFFTSPDGLVEFYVYSPQWSGEPTDILPNPLMEVVTDRKEQRGKDRTVLFLTLKAKDGSYWRSLADTRTVHNTRTVFGIKYLNMAGYEKYRPDYLRFKQSLRQYAD